MIIKIESVASNLWEKYWLICVYFGFQEINVSLKYYNFLREVY